MGTWKLSAREAAMAVWIPITLPSISKSGQSESPAARGQSDSNDPVAKSFQGEVTHRDMAPGPRVGDPHEAGVAVEINPEGFAVSGFAIGESEPHRAIGPATNMTGGKDK